MLIYALARQNLQPGRVCRPVLQILTLFQTQKCHFHPRFSDLEVVTKRNITCLRKMSSLLRLKLQKKFFKIYFQFAYYTFFLIHLELKRRTHWYITVVPSYTIPDQNGQNLYPFSEKTLPFGEAHTYMAYIRECPPPPPPEETASSAG